MCSACFSETSLQAHHMHVDLPVQAELIRFGRGSLPKKTLRGCEDALVGDDGKIDQRNCPPITPQPQPLSLPPSQPNLNEPSCTAEHNSTPPG